MKKMIILKHNLIKPTNKIKNRKLMFKKFYLKKIQNNNNKFKKTQIYRILKIYKYQIIPKISSKNQFFKN